MPISKNKLINLIPQDDFQSSTFGRIVKWALSTFRAVVIITELIVMSAFLSRFWLDSRNSDLNDEINISKTQIVAYKPIEDEMRSIQKRLDIAKSIYNENKHSSTLKEVSNQIPNDVNLKSITVINNEITIKAISFSEKSVAQFFANLESSKNFRNVNLTQVSSSMNNNSLTQFTIEAKQEDRKVTN